MLSDRFIVDVFPILSQDGAGSSAATGAPVQEQTEIQWLASPIATSTQQARGKSSIQFAKRSGKQKARTRNVCRKRDGDRRLEVVLRSGGGGNHCIPA